MVKDYSQGIIYKIWSNNTGRCYIGSTVQRLSARMGGHRKDYKFYKKGGKKYCSSFIILEDGDIKYERIAKNPCENLEQLRKAEGFYQKKYECVNIRTAGRTAKDWYQDNKQKIKEYHQDNKEKISKYHKKWHEENKENIKEYRRKNRQQILKRDKEYRQNNKEKLNKKNNCLCCGGRYTTDNWCKHVKTKKHIKTQALQEEIQSLIPLYHQ